jgi:Icc-related predicted phosphoesterase
MKLLLIADIDDLHWKHGAGDADLILSLGDNADQLILEAAKAYHCPHVFAVRGNHDHNADAPFPAPISDLHMTVQKFNGMTFGGLNGALKPYGHYRQAKHPFLHEQSEVCRYMSAFPAADVFISHNSPRGVHERNEDAYAGFDGLINYIFEHKPKYLFHGHQHINRETACDATKVICVYGWKVMEI